MNKAYILIILLFVSFLTAMPVSSATILTVNPSHDSAYIQNLIDNVVEDGGTIYFEPGTYYVNLEIGTINPVNKSFSLVGAGEGATILYSNTPPNEIITDIGQGTHVTTIKGFTMMNGCGAIFTNGTSPIITNCTFIGTGSALGSAICNAGTSTPIITNCTFIGNSNDDGGAICNGGSSPFITNCAFYGNSGYSGGAIYNENASPIITNCTFTGNTAQTGCAVFNAGTSTPIITNCILWNDNCTEIYDDINATSLVSYSNVQGGHTGVGNIDAHPLFNNVPNDLSLQSDSPCIDAGTNTSAFIFGSVRDDIRGLPRPQGSAYDMGAYECQMNGWSPVSIMPLMRTQLANVLNEWNEIAEDLPVEPTDEMAELIERIQAYMQNATQLTNPVYASGELSKALSLMEELTMLLE